MSGYVQPWLSTALETLLGADFGKAPNSVIPKANEFAGYRFPAAAAATKLSARRSQLPHSPAVVVMRALSDADIILSDGKWFIFAHLDSSIRTTLHSHGWGEHAKGCIFLCDEYEFVSLPQVTSPFADIGLLISKVTVVAGGAGIGLDEGDSANAITHVCDSPLIRARWRAMKLSMRLERAPVLSGFDPQAASLLRHIQVGVSGLNTAKRPLIHPLSPASLLDPEDASHLARKLRFGPRSAPPPIGVQGGGSSAAANSSAAAQMGVAHSGMPAGANESASQPTSLPLNPATAAPPPAATHSPPPDSCDSQRADASVLHHASPHSQLPGFTPASSAPPTLSPAGEQGELPSLPTLPTLLVAASVQAGAVAAGHSTAASQTAASSSDERLLALAAEAALHDSELDSDSGSDGGGGEGVRTHASTRTGPVSDGHFVQTQAPPEGGVDDEDWEELVGGGASQSSGQHPPPDLGMAAALRGAALPRRSAPTQGWGGELGGACSSFGNTSGNTSGEKSPGMGAASDAAAPLNDSSIPLAQPNATTSASSGAVGGVSEGKSHSDPSTTDALLNSVSVDIVSGTLSSELAGHSHSGDSKLSQLHGISAGLGTLSTIVSHSSSSGGGSGGTARSEAPQDTSAGISHHEEGAAAAAETRGTAGAAGDAAAAHNTSSGSGSTGKATVTSTVAACSQELEGSPPISSNQSTPPPLTGQQGGQGGSTVPAADKAHTEAATGVMNDTLTSSDASAVSTLARPPLGDAVGAAPPSSTGGRNQQAGTPPHGTPPHSATARSVSFSFVVATQTSTSPATQSPPLRGHAGGASPLPRLVPTQSPIAVQGSQPEMRSPLGPASPLDATQLQSPAGASSQSSVESGGGTPQSRGPLTGTGRGAKRSREEPNTKPAALVRVDTDGFVVPPPKRVREGGFLDDSVAFASSQAFAAEESQMAVFSQEQQDERSLFNATGTPIRSPLGGGGQEASPLGGEQGGGAALADSFSRNELFGIAADTQDSQLGEGGGMPPPGCVNEGGGLEVTASPEPQPDATNGSMSLAQPDVSHRCSLENSPSGVQQPPETPHK